MKFSLAAFSAVTSIALDLTSFAASAADYPAPKRVSGSPRISIPHGQTMPELKLHYSTTASPPASPVLVLHAPVGRPPAC